MANEKTRVRDVVKRVLHRKDAHGLTREQREARARHRDLQQLQRIRSEKGRHLDLLQAEVAQLDAEIALGKAVVDAAVAALG